MKTRFFHLMPAAGVLALCAAAFAAEPASVPSNETSPEAMIAPGEVTLHFNGAQRVFQSGRGGIDVIEADGTLEHFHPELYQTINGKRKTVRYRYHVIDSNHVELKAVHPDESAPIEVAPHRTNS